MKMLSIPLRMRRVRARLSCLFVPLFLLPCAGSAGQLALLAVAETPEPFGDGLYEGFHAPMVNARGEVAVRLTLYNEDWVLRSRNALHLWRDGEPEELFRSDPVDPPHGILSIRSTARGLDRIAFNERGSIGAFTSVSEVLAPGSTVNHGMFRFDRLEGTIQGPVSTETVPGGGATFTTWASWSMNNNDQIALRSNNRVTLNEFYGSTDRMEPDGSVTRLAVNGMEVPGTGVVINNILGGHAINDRGQIAFTAALNIGEEEGTTHGVLLADDDGVRLIVRAGDPIPDGNGVFANRTPHFPVLSLDDHGRVAFRGWVEGQGIRAVNVLSDGETGHVLVRNGDPIPGGGTFANVGTLSINNNGLAVFVGADGRDLYFANSSGIRRAMTREMPAPGGGSFGGWPSGVPRRIAINDRGQTAFVARVSFPRPDGPGSDHLLMLLFRDEFGTLHELIREGAEIAGSPVDEILLSDAEDSFGDRGRGSGLGEAGHVTFRVTLADDREAIFLWTPPGVQGLAQAAGTGCADGGWCELPWFGEFYQDRRWVWHDVHGWQLFGGTDGTHLAFFDFEAGAWMWTSEDLFPVYYAGAPVDAWVAFDAESAPGERRFFRYDTGEWLDAADLVE
ncbi:MAG: hypothetical protein JJU00_09335 [Opitutales bacterium]|nr:hypothetical protein [Opitutales bacterium]